MAEGREIRHALANGANGFLPKPFRMIKLFELLSHIDFEFIIHAKRELKEEKYGSIVRLVGVLIDFDVRIRKDISSLEGLEKIITNELFDLFKDFPNASSELNPKWKDLEVDGLDAKQLEYKALAGGEPIVRKTYVFKKGILYIISSGNTISLNQYDKILSTFRFID